MLLRHGKSDWSEPLADRDRPLAPRGRRQAAASGAWLAAHGPAIDLAVVSPARRAVETWERVVDAFAAHGAPAPPSVLDERVYCFDADDLRAVVADPAHASRGCIALVGHDPGISDLASALAGSPVAMPTSAVAVLALGAGSGGDVIEGAAVLQAHGRPPAGPGPSGQVVGRPQPAR